jgi:TRAP-type C4-dicarboxylate transport system permease small subunit
MKILNAIVNTIHMICKMLKWVSGFAILAMAVLSTIDVIARYIFKSPVSGTMEMVQVLMNVFVYAGLGMAVYMGKLISVPVLLEKMPNMARGKVEGIGNFISAGMTVIIIWQLLITTSKYLGNSIQSTTLLHIPYGPFYLFTTICFCLICAELIIQGVLKIRYGSVVKSETSKESEV